MKNLEQIRAKNALKSAKEPSFSGKNGGQVVKKVPTMIMENGILGALAFAIENNGSGYDKVFVEIINHLKIINKKVTCGDDCRSFAGFLVNLEVNDLRAITTESMSFLNYLRRFAK